MVAQHAMNEEAAVKEDVDVTAQSPLAKVDFKNKKTIGIIVAIVAVIIVIAIVVFTGQGKTDVGNGYELTNQKIAKDEVGLTQIEGNIKNTNPYAGSFFIGWDLYDKDGKLIGYAIASTDDLEPDEVARFEAVTIGSDIDAEDPLAFEDNIASFELSEANFSRRGN